MHWSVLTGREAQARGSLYDGPVTTRRPRALRGQGQVDAGGARELRDALNRCFDVAQRDHHESAGSSTTTNGGVQGAVEAGLACSSKSSMCLKP